MYTIKKQINTTKSQSGPELRGIMHDLSSLYARYRKPVLIVVSAALAVLVAAGGYTLYQASSDSKASALLSQAYGFYSPNQAGQSDYRRALDLFKEVRKRYPGTMSAAAAQFYVGNCLMSMGQTQEAVAAYQDFIKHYAGEKELLGFVYQRMGYAYDALGNRDEALKSFERSETILGPGLSTFELARAYEQAGKTEDARKKYQSLAERLPGTQLAEEARKKAPPAAPGAMPAKTAP